MKPEITKKHIYLVLIILVLIFYGFAAVKIGFHLEPSLLKTSVNKCDKEEEDINIEQHLANMLAQYTVKIGKTNIVVCFDFNDEASSAFKAYFIEAVNNHGGKINLMQCQFSADNFSPESIFSQAVSYGADALLILPSLDKVNEAIETIRANDDRLILLGNDSLYTNKTLEDGIWTNGMVLAVPSSDRNMQGTLVEVKPSNKSRTGFYFQPIESSEDFKNN